MKSLFSQKFNLLYSLCKVVAVLFIMISTKVSSLISDSLCPSNKQTRQSKVDKVVLTIYSKGKNKGSLRIDLNLGKT